MSLWTGVVSCTLHRSFLIFHVRNVLFYQWWGGGVERSRALLRVTQLLLLTMNLEAAGCQTREASTLPCCLPTGPAGFRFALMDWFLLSPAFSCPSSLTHCCSSECPLHPLGQNTSLLTPPLNTASLLSKPHPTVIKLPLAGVIWLSPVSR